MLLRNKRTGKVDNIKDITIEHNGPFTDLITYSTCKFFFENTDPKVFLLELMDKNTGKTHTRRYNITSSPNHLQSLLADIRFRLLGDRGDYMVTRFRTYYKPEHIIRDEKQFLTFGLIQDPILYTVIFHNDTNKPDE